MNVVNIDVVVCKGCGICVSVCPQDTLAMSSDRNNKGYNTVQIVEPESCTGCKLCEICCPDLAIYVIAPAGKK